MLHVANGRVRGITWGSLIGTLASQTDVQTALDGKQAALVSGTTIKTINGAGVLGSGDLTVSGSAAWGDVTGTLANQTDLQTALDGKSATSHTHTGVYEAANANIQTHVASAHAPSTAQANADITKAEIEAKLIGEISSHSHAGGSEAFPVGSVFLAVVATNPATLLGYGTWSAFAAGRMLVGLDAGQTEFDTVEETGGAKTHTLTTAEIPAHTHQTLRERSATTGSATTQIARTADTTSTVDTNVFTESAGGGGAHQNLPPYVVCYMWKRTA